MQNKLSVAPPKQFDFKNTIFSHGWCALVPFAVTAKPLSLHTNLRMTPDKNYSVQYQMSGNKEILILIDSEKSVSKPDKDKIISFTQQIFSFKNDLSEFYRIAKTMEKFRWVVQKKAGRMLCAPTFFEDVVKMILTTNCSWSLTTSMCKNLVKYCSDESDNNSPFPVAGQIAEKPEKFLREKVKLGYRAPFVKKFAEDVVKGKIAIEQFRISTDSTVEIYKQLRNIKGVGDYAASNLLKLLGRFDYLGLDSWCRKKFYELHANGKPVDDKKIEAHYAKYGNWKGLFLWLELTREWYYKKNPFDE